MNSDIKANADAIADIKELIGDTAVSTQISDAIVQSDWNETDTVSKAFIKNKPDLNDLS